MTKNAARPARTVYTVSRLNQEVNTLLAGNFGVLWVEGEISNFSQPASGHFYFSIKDSRSQLRCAMFRGRNRYLDFRPENGQQVLLRGKPGVYEARGDFQFIADHMEMAGHGKLQQLFEETKLKLEKEGLFDPISKKSLPVWPESIGLITSPTGAAVKDILNVLSRRYPSANVVIYPTQVQGQAAVGQICSALEIANRRQEVDVILLSRGGGSLEDLWAFNDEAVARAVHECQIPIICGVGHEVDFTISDFVADLRAPTPSAAAEMATPDSADVYQALKGIVATMHSSLQRVLQPTTTLLAQLNNRLAAKHPERVLAQHFQRADELEERLKLSLSKLVRDRRQLLNHQTNRLRANSPARHLTTHHATVATSRQRLGHAIKTLLESKVASLANSSRALDTVSPLATLQRGYAVVRHGNSILTAADKIKGGDIIEAQLSRGHIKASVLEVKLPEK